MPLVGNLGWDSATAHPIYSVCFAPRKFFFFYIFNIKVYNNEITDDTTYELLYDTTNTVPGGAIYHDYPLGKMLELSRMS